MPVNSEIHVAVGVLKDAEGNVLITRRPDHVHQGGLWEFPGGKLEPGESVIQALIRELHEEIGIQVISASPLIKVKYDYGDRQVLLDVLTISVYTGVETACEGQGMQWVTSWQLDEFDFPAANLPIIKAVQLPEYYPILEGSSKAEILYNCQKILQQGVKMLQLRIKSLPVADITEVKTAVLEMCQQLQVLVLINSDLPAEAGFAAGIHLSSRSLMSHHARPAGYVWVAASCHNLAELVYAEKLGVDFAVLAPVLPTASHPQAQPLGWDGLSTLLEQVNLPVYALGGLTKVDLDRAKYAGAQGIAGISAFLE